MNEVIDPDIKPVPPTFLKRYGIYGGVITAVLLVGALGILGYKQQSAKHNDAATIASPTPLVSVSPSADVSPSASEPTPASSSTPSPATPTPTSTPLSSAEYQAQAKAHYQNKQYKEAAAAYVQAAAQTQNKAELGRIWNLAGNAYREAGDKDNAVIAYKKSIGYDATIGDPYLNEAAVLWLRGDKDEAKSVLQNGIDVKASKSTDLSNLLSVYEVQSQ